MGKRLGPLALLLSTTGSLSAAPLRNLNTLEYEYRDQQLSSRTPRIKRPDHVNVLGARSLFLSEEAKFTALAELGASAGDSGSASFTTLQARSAATWRSAHSSDTLEIGWLKSHGADASQRPLEETVLEIGAPFTSTRAGYRHDQRLDPMNAIVLSAGISRNLDGTTELQSREIGAGWSHLLSRSWSNTLSLIRGTQSIKSGNDTHTWEIRNDDLWDLNNGWSLQTTVGGLQQKSESDTGNSVIMGAAVSYLLNITTADEEKEKEKKKKKAQPITQDKIRRPETDRIENVRTQSQLRAGWDRNLDQRRTGDAKFLADQFYIQSLWVIDPEQNLQLDLRRSQSIDKNTPGAKDLVSHLANLDYRWTTAVGSESSGILGSFGLGITQEQVKQNPQRYDRQLLRVSYAVTF